MQTEDKGIDGRQTERKDESGEMYKAVNQKDQIHHRRILIWCKGSDMTYDMLQTAYI